MRNNLLQGHRSVCAMRRILRPSSQKDIFRILVASLVLVYGRFFYRITTTTNIFTHHDHPSQDGNTIYLPANQFPLLIHKEGESPPLPTTTAKTDWVNGIVEGDVDRYISFQDGNHKNLWDHSTVIPSWMKRKWCLLVVVFSI